MVQVHEAIARFFILRDQRSLSIDRRAPMAVLRTTPGKRPELEMIIPVFHYKNPVAYSGSPPASITDRAAGARLATGI